MGYLWYVQKSRFLISGASMMPTLHKKDMVEVDREIFKTRGPERGEVVVYRPLDDPKYVMVGRVVGVAGDKISFLGRKLNVNGSPVHKSSEKKKVKIEGEEADVEESIETLGSHTYSVWYMNNVPDMEFGEITVPPDQFFMMGDNRDNSKDSRYMGTVPRSHFIGLVRKVVEGESPDRAGKQITP